MGRMVHAPLKQRIYDELVRMIVSGEVGLGDQLDELSIAERLGVSRTPLREAIGQLVRDGLLEYRPYKGCSVRSFTPKEIDDLYAVRKAMESLGVRLAVARLKEGDVAAIKAVLDATVTALEAGDLEGYATHDRRFHDLVARLADNRTLVETLDRLSLQIQLCRVVANQAPDVVERTAKERQALLEAFTARDADRAAALMEEHIEGVRGAVMAKLRVGEHDDEAAA